MNDELKPCPFCGGEAKLKHGYRRKGEKFGNKAYVQCKNVDAKHCYIAKAHMKDGKQSMK